MSRRRPFCRAEGKQRRRASHPPDFTRRVATRWAEYTHLEGEPLIPNPPIGLGLVRPYLPSKTASGAAELPAIVPKSTPGRESSESA